MSIKGLVLSAAYSADKSAYTHRLTKLAECLKERSIHCDFFFMPDNPPLDTETTASLFMPIHLRMLNQYDFVYCGGEESAQSLFFCKPFLKPKVIVDIHGDLNAQSALAREVESSGKIKSPSPRVRMIDAMGKRIGDHFLTVCRPQFDSLIRNGYSSERISLIRNGVDLDLFKPLPYPDEPEFTFAYIGEFQVWQGIDLLLEAYSSLDDSDGRLLMVGFRDKDAEVKSMFKNKFGDRVELVDRVDRPELMNLIESVKVLIIPRKPHLAIKHAFPTKFAEYAAVGRAVMVNDVDETADFVKKYQCGFVSQPDPESMARIMKSAAAASISDLIQMGNNARTMTEENFSWKTIGDNYYRTVLKMFP